MQLGDWTKNISKDVADDAEKTLQVGLTNIVDDVLRRTFLRTVYD